MLQHTSTITFFHFLELTLYRSSLISRWSLQIFILQIINPVWTQIRYFKHIRIIIFFRNNFSMLPWKSKWDRIWQIQKICSVKVNFCSIITLPVHFFFKIISFSIYLSSGLSYKILIEKAADVVSLFSGFTFTFFLITSPFITSSTASFWISSEPRLLLLLLVSSFLSMYWLIERLDVSKSVISSILEINDCKCLRSGA